MTDPVQIPLEPMSEPFFDAAARGELRVQRCDGCARFRFPPRPVCPWCHDRSWTWTPTSGRGRIWSFVVPHPPLPAPYDARSPYNVVVVELDDDPLVRLVGNVVETADELRYVDAGRLAIGAVVAVVFPPVPGEPAMPRWILA
jgi:uncharacterized OB-fold protein